MSLSALVGGLVLAVVSGGSEPSSTADLKAYETAKAKAGRDPEAHVKLALWCERHGLAEERARHLALAVFLEPRNVAARGFLGLVRHDQKWQSPDSVRERIESDEALNAKLAAYHTRRDELDRQATKLPAAKAAQAHVTLGQWCETEGLHVEARAHFTAAVMLDPGRDTTWRRLGYVKHRGRWMSREEVEGEAREAELQREATRRWEPQLRQWKSQLGSESTSAEVRLSLLQVHDPRAVPAVVRVFRDDSELNQTIAVLILGQIDAPSATRELASLAVWGASAQVRKAATSALKSREPRDYVGMLVEMIREPIRYMAEPVPGPGATGALAIETPRLRMLRTYTTPGLFQLSPRFVGYVGYTDAGVPVPVQQREATFLASPSSVNAAQTAARIEARAARLLAVGQWKAEVAQQALLADVTAMEAANQRSGAVNERVIPVLEEAAGAPKLTNDEEPWQRWWCDQLGLAYERRPPITVVVDASPPQAPPPTFSTGNSCFVAGTPVRTRDGRRPIETLRVGDQILTQDTATGALEFQPVIAVHHNPPATILRVACDNGDMLEASSYHRFWRAGRGWAMVRELREGDLLRTYSGVARVLSVTAAPEAPVFNLDVAENRTFFVGRHDALVRDNSLPDVLRTRPFDAEPELAAASTGKVE